MDPDLYKVEILHYLDPHLIWVLVESKDDVYFEQIGIYGILPLSMSFDIEGNLITERCEAWLPAVFVAMKKILLEASEVWFSVTFLDRTTSIFDNNVHKYGDLTIKMNDGKTVSMFESLLETGFVIEDLKFFPQNLKTKLDYITSVGVVNKIKEALPLLRISSLSTKDLDAILSKQTSVFQKTVELEEAFVGRNMCRGLRENQTLMTKQINGLSACKDVDEVSAGRACKKGVASGFNSTLMRKLELLELQSCNDIPKNDTDLKSESNSLSVNQIEKETDTNYEVPRVFPVKNKTKKVKETRTKEPNNGKRFIAFGPPGINPTQYHVKEVEIDTVKPVGKEIQAKENNQPNNMLYRVDSDEYLEEAEVGTLKLNGTKDVYKNPKTTSRPNLYNNAKDRVPNHTPDLKNGNRASTSVLRRLTSLKDRISKMNESSSTADTDSARQGDDSDNESISAIVAKLDLSSGSIKKEVKSEPDIIFNDVKHNVNPFKNLDGSKSVFVDKLVRPTLLVHTKNGNRIQPTSNLRDIPFGTDIKIVLKNMSVNSPMRLQTVSWPTILRGHSVFLVSPSGSGKTIGYLPAICRLVSDTQNTAESLSIARLTCIIVCATAKSVSHVEELCKMFLHKERIFACYAGMTDITISTTILNGCDILITTPVLLVHLLRENLGVDLRSLNTFVIDDCERISEVYQNELKFCLFKVKEMLKARANKEVKVQYVVASRIWDNFMSSLAKKAPDSIVCIGAFQECVLYSESDTSFQFLAKEKKVDAVIDFLESIDKSKKTVIACRSDDEVQLLEKALTSLKHVVYACDSTMTVEDLYNIDFDLEAYQEPLKGPILVCCDSNLTHLNITDAHYLIHFSLPELFSMFSKRFAVLIDNYASVFNNQDSGVKIQILLETSNVEQLPKILNFIKRCTDNVPAELDQISATVMSEKDFEKAKVCVPLCTTLLKLGKCPDIWNCKERHSIFRQFDKPLDWIPSEGTITFKILHYHSPVHYSARVLSCTTNRGITKYPQTYSMISIKLGMYYSKEKNKKLHGIAKPGDVCAVAIQQNLFARCKVIKVLKYTTNNVPSLMLINLIDEEVYERVTDTCLYHLPEELKNIESHVVKVILANIAPQDRDITFSKLAEIQLKKITENNDDLYMRGQISLVIGNSIFVETLEACQDLSSLNETVVKNNFRNELLSGHAVDNPDHISTLKSLVENIDLLPKKVQIDTVEIPKPIREPPKARWAHLEREGQALVYYLYAKSPSVFFVQLEKFQSCLNMLLSDIQKYVSENPAPVDDVKEGDIVLAEFPDDACYERARIDSKIDNNKVNCFFVDLGDWRKVPIDKILPISEKIITQLPFQAIECRLVGIRPVGEEWSEFSTNWLVDQFYGTGDDLKYLFAIRFTAEKAEFTDGFKYGVALINTYGEDNVCINNLMIDSNLAIENDEVEYLNNIDLGKTLSDDNDHIAKENEEKKKNKRHENKVTDSSTSRNSNSSSISFPSYAKDDSSSSGSLNNFSFVGSTVSSNNNIKLTDETMPKMPLSELVNKNKIGTINKSNILQTSNNNQVALVSPASVMVHDAEKRRESETVECSSSSVLDDYKENFRTNQQTIMNLLGSKPIRSMPLVGDDEDLDDSRWDSANPVQMLMVPNSDTSNITKSPKIIPASIENVKSEFTETAKSEKETNKSNKVTDLTTENSTINLTTVKPISKVNAGQIDTTTLNTNNKTDKWSVSESNQTILLYDNSTPVKIKMSWRQDNRNVTLEVQVKVAKYEVVIKDKEIKFLSEGYGFEFELYGVVNVDKSTHSNKGTHVEIKLNKISTFYTKWLSLYKGYIKKYTVLDDRSKKETVKGDRKKNNDVLRKPKVLWHQNKHRVTMKILLITDRYAVNISDRHLAFKAEANEEVYGFEFELYGVVDVSKSSHSNKGQYIQVSLQKVMMRNWLMLGKGFMKKWIVYDVDNIDVSSEDEQESSTEHLDNLRKSLNLNQENDSDEDFQDDVNFGYQ